MSENKLFVVCPHSSMEPFLRSRFGNEILFLTGSGSILALHDEYYAQAINDFIRRENISSITVVHDLSCRFVDSIIYRKNLIGLPVETKLEEIYIEHYFSDFKNLPLDQQVQRLAELNVLYQCQAILSSEILSKTIRDRAICVHGIVTTRRQNRVHHLELKKERIHYEC